MWGNRFTVRFRADETERGRPESEQHLGEGSKATSVISRHTVVVIAENVAAPGGG